MTTEWGRTHRRTKSRSQLSRGFGIKKTARTFTMIIGRVFRAHGEFCASHPWEVIVALLTLTACMMTVERKVDPISGTTSHLNRMKPQCPSWGRDTCDTLEAEYNAIDGIFMTIVRSSALLYCYYQFCHLNNLGSKYILGEYKRVASHCHSSARRFACLNACHWLWLFIHWSWNYLNFDVIQLALSCPVIAVSFPQACRVLCSTVAALKRWPASSEPVQWSDDLLTIIITWGRNVHCHIGGVIKSSPSV